MLERTVDINLGRLLTWTAWLCTLALTALTVLGVNLGVVEDRLSMALLAVVVGQAAVVLSIREQHMRTQRVVRAAARSLSRGTDGATVRSL